MNKYETVMIINATISEEKRNKVIKSIEEFISKKGKILSKEALGEKKLAYEVKKQKKGYYYLIMFKLGVRDIEKLEKIYRLTDEILKFIVVRVDE